MKKATYLFIVILSGTLALVSCQKEYHCGCTYNNKVVFTKDLGTQYKNNAKDKCSSYDSSVIGELWHCTLY